MPVRKVQGGYQWDKSGKVYPTLVQAERQGRAIIASGYKENVKMSQFVDVIKDVSKEYGALCVDLFAELPITHENYQTYMVDTYHANDKGCALIEDLLLNKMIALYGYM